jgi:nicotinamidase-related amidase
MTRLRDDSSWLPIPAFYDALNAARWSYRPDQQALFEAAEAYRREQKVSQAGQDTLRLHLLLIDLQKDFCLPEGSLFVAGRSGSGAIDDSDRIATFVYRNLEAITEITCTLDTHFPHQIFFASFWRDADGRPPQPHREITTDDIRAGRIWPNPAIASWLCDGDVDWLEKQVAHYCSELERAGKYTLYLWPPHCILGSDGHAMVGTIHEARLFHAYVRGSRSWIEVKGGHALTENYSVLAPEVLSRHDGNPLARRNTEFINGLLAADAVVIAGQAASHCVKATIEDLLHDFEMRGQRLARKVYILSDCMSAVTVPDPESPGELLFDFTDQAESALARFAEVGMHVVRSTDPLTEWPGLMGT